MISFVVWHEGLAEGTGTWVLAVDGDRLLLADAEGDLYWKPMSECKAKRFHTPDSPTLIAVKEPLPVVLMQPQPATGILTGSPMPGAPVMFPNRQQRRANGLH